MKVKHILFYLFLIILILVILSLTIFISGPGPDNYSYKPNNEPQVDNPLVVPKEIVMIKDKEIKLEIGYYNNAIREAKDAKIGISECIAEDNKKIDFTKPEGTETFNPLEVISPTITMPSNTAKGFKIRLVDNSKNADNEHKLIIGTYVCTMVVYNAGEEQYDDGWGDFPTESKDNPYEKIQFFLKVQGKY